MSQSHLFYMERALRLARRAEAQGEVPVGAVLVYGGDIIGEGWNQSITENDPTAHGEIMALRQGAKALGNYRLVDTTLYVTLEPCIMCAGALVHARVQLCVYGASDPKGGALCKHHQWLEALPLNHRVQHMGGVLGEESSDLLKAFFQARRVM